MKIKLEFSNFYGINYNSLNTIIFFKIGGIILNLKIIKIFSNNVVLCKNINENTEMIALGKGIGFNKKPDMTVSKDSIDKLYQPIDEKDRSYFNEITNSIDKELIGIVEESMKIIDDELEGKLSSHFHITMLSHITFAIERTKYGTIIKNPFLEEIKMLYFQEYSISEKFINDLNNKLDNKLVKDEIGFISMHVHAAIRGVKVSETSEQLKLIYDLLKIIEKELGQNIDKDSPDFIRLLTHLKFAVNRVKNNIKIENILLPEIKVKLKKYYKVSKKVASFAKKFYLLEFSEDEIGYITIHLAKIKSKDLEIF